MPFGPARGQDYPSRPVTTVVPFAAGGAGDILSRILSKHLEQRLGKPFVVENKPGAGGVTGVLAMTKSAPDGYTLLMTPSGPVAVNPTLMKSLPYDPVADMMPLALVAGTPFMLVVNPALPINSLADLIKYSKERPDPIPFAMVGPGTPHHLFAEMLKGMTGIKVRYVPYRGSQPAITDVIAGHVPMMFCDLGPAGPQIASGKVRAIGSSTKARLAAFPNVPSLHEAGATGFDAASWQMLVAHGKTPRPVVDKLNAELKSILALPDVKEAIAKNGMVPMPENSVEGLQKFVKAEIERWSKVVNGAGIAGSQ
jgi:tripartite-type tricarboxylate transporter receptor subunit TctC